MFRASVVAAVLAAVVSSVRAEQHLLVRVTGLDKSVAYEVMTSAEFRDLQNQLRTEDRLYRKAEAEVREEWKSDESATTGPFPSSYVAARSARSVRSFSKKEEAEEKKASYEEREARAATDDLAELQALRRQNSEKYARETEKQAERRKAADMLKARIEKLLAEEKQAAGADAEPAK